MSESEVYTHFGFQTIPAAEKAEKVGAIFHSVAEQYDVMNDLMSFGVHRLWKHLTMAYSGVRPGAVVLDLAGGTGDVARLLYRRAMPGGAVYVADLNASMLQVGRDRLLDAGLGAGLHFVQANAEMLPFVQNRFDVVTIAFGLRNVTDKLKALQSMYRVCKPGGKVMVLEFSHPTHNGLKSLYDWYSFHVLPKLGQWVANDAASYQYLVESIRMHPSQDALRDMIQAAGFEDCTYHNFSGGIVALHIGYKY